MYLGIADAGPQSILAVLAHHSRIIARLRHHRPDPAIKIDEAGQVRVGPRERKRGAPKELFHRRWAHSPFEMNMQFGLREACEIRRYGGMLHGVLAISSRQVPSVGPEFGP